MEVPKGCHTADSSLLLLRTNPEVFPVILLVNGRVVVYSFSSYTLESEEDSVITIDEQQERWWKCYS